MLYERCQEANHSISWMGVEVVTGLKDICPMWECYVISIPKNYLNTQEIG